jgi:hypothetical protein
MRPVLGIVLKKWRIATALLLMLPVQSQHAWARHPYPHYTFILPDGYVGWVQVIFNDPNASPLPWKGGGYEIEVPESGIPRTSDILVRDSNPKRKDEFYYRSALPNGNAELRPVPSEYVMPGELHSGFDVMDTGGKGRGYSWFIFIGPPEVRARVPLADWDKVVASHETPDGRFTRISITDTYPTPGRMTPSAAK